MKLSPAFRLRLHASARPLFILAEARLVPDVTRLRRVLATRLLHSRQGWCRRAQTGLRALPLPAFITWQFTMVRSRRTRHLRCTHSSRSTHHIRTRLATEMTFRVSRKQFLARFSFRMPFRGSQRPIFPRLGIKNSFPANFNRFLTRLTFETPFQACRTRFLARLTSKTRNLGSRKQFLPRGQNNAAYKVITFGGVLRETGQNIFRSRAVSRVSGIETGDPRQKKF